MAKREISQIINLGCSFAYGNRASKYDVLSEDHRSPATWFAERYKIKEVNIARPGNSNGGIVDTAIQWLADADKRSKRDSIFLVGWSAGYRFGYVSDQMKISNNQRAKSWLGETGANAFTMGPENPYRYQIDKWDDRWAAGYINLEETGRLHFYRNVIALQNLAARYEIPVIHYHGLQSTRPDRSTECYPEINKMTNLIEAQWFYNFEKDSLQQLVNSNPETYKVSPGDSHPNHRAYADWTKQLIDWFESMDKFNCSF